MQELESARPAHQGDRRKADGRVSRFRGAAAAVVALSYAEVQAGLADDEVLLFYADTGQLGEAGFETYLWAVPKQGEPRWLRLERSTGELSGAVRQLRALIGVGLQTRGAQSLAAGTKSDRTGDVLEAAKQLHDALLRPVADMIEGKSLVVVPSRKLSSLPFQLLVSLDAGSLGGPLSRCRAG